MHRWDDYVCNSADVSNTIQKMSSGVKKRDDDYKNGNGGGLNGTPQHSVDPTEENNLDS